MSCSIGIAIGDPNGIGPEIAVMAAERLLCDAGLRPVLIGDPKVLLHYSRRDASVPLVEFSGATPARGAIEYVAVEALPAGAFEPGRLDPHAGAATVAYAAEAVRLAMEGRIDAIVACPHSETAVNRAGIAFDGYPGLLADLTGTPRDSVFLMLVAAGLRIGHVTLHEQLSRALSRLSAERIVAAGLACDKALRRLGVARPSLGVFGINPHAGEGGLFGDDDTRATAPAVAMLREQGVDAHGPAGADALLASRRHDAYLAMYHDQGHVPIKLLSPNRASALAIGTSVLFSSVGHGCAFDIAGRGCADPTSVVETARLLAAGAATVPALPFAER